MLVLEQQPLDERRPHPVTRPHRRPSRSSSGVLSGSPSATGRHTEARGRYTRSGPVPQRPVHQRSQLGQAGRPVAATPRHEQPLDHQRVRLRREK